MSAIVEAEAAIEELSLTGGTEKEEEKEKEVQVQTSLGAEGESQEQRIAWLRERGCEVDLFEERNKNKAKPPTPSENSILITIVKVPADPKEPYSEVKIPIEKGQAGDQLVALLRIYFKDATSINIDELRTAATKQFSNQAMTISPKTLSHIESSVETFPLSHPSVVNNQRRVLLYLDEAGQLKKLPPNPRASGIAAMCGFENVPFAGDMFIGRVVVGPKGMANVDFFQNELDSSALWLKDIKRVNYDHGVKSNRVTMDPTSDAGMWNPDNQKGEDQALGLTWQESDENMDVSFTLPPAFTKVAAKQVKVTFKTRSLLVSVQNNTPDTIKTPSGQDVPPSGWALLFEAPLAGAIRPDECTWGLDNQAQPPRIECTMEKTSEVRWGKLKG